MNAKPVRGPDDGSSGDDDPRPAFVYQEAVRGLVHQQIAAWLLSIGGI